MRLLLDTQLLIWTAARPERVSRTAAQLIGQAGPDIFFSAASIWEVAIKHALTRTVTDWPASPL